MHLSVAFLLLSAAIVQAQSNNNFGNNNFGQPFRSQQSRFGSKFGESFNSASGNAAAAGNAEALGQGSSVSINQANQEAANGMTRASGLSANTATGTHGSRAGGAAQAGGQVQGGKRFQSNMRDENASVGGRRKRSVDGPTFAGYFGGNSRANADASGGGSALQGSIRSDNRAYTNTNPFSANSFGNSNSMGTGHGVNLFSATNTEAASGVFGR